MTEALTQTTGVILIDHGSQRSESNAMLLDAVEIFRKASKWSIVEPAHMELAEPTMADAFDRCVAQGAVRIVVFPYFLSPGRHWHEDIPHLAAEAAKKHPGVSYLVTAPFALHPLLPQIIEQRIDQCMRRVDGSSEKCDFCTRRDGCGLEAAEIG